MQTSFLSFLVLAPPSFLNIFNNRAVSFLLIAAKHLCVHSIFFGHLYNKTSNHGIN